MIKAITITNFSARFIGLNLKENFSFFKKILKYNGKLLYYAG